MTNHERDEEFDVVFSGSDEMIGSRVTKFVGIWTPPRRIYNKTGKHRGEWKPKKKVKPLRAGNGFRLDPNSAFSLQLDALEAFIGKIDNVLDED